MLLFLETAHEGVRLFSQIFLCAGQRSRMYTLLQHIVQVLIRIQVRGVGRRVEHLDLVLVLCQPCLYEFSVMDFEIVNNEKNFTSGILHQSFHEVYETLLRHGLLVAHEAAGPLAADGGNHVDFLQFRVHLHHGSNPLRREAANMILPIVDAGFVSPLNGCLFFFRPFGDGGILLLHEVPSLYVVLDARLLGGALACQSPTIQVVRDTTQWHIDTVQLVNELLHGGSGPKSKAEFHLVGVFVDDDSLNFFLLPDRQGPFFPLLATLGFLFGKAAVFPESADDATHRVVRDVQRFDNFVMLFSCQMKMHCLFFDVSSCLKIDRT